MITSISAWKRCSDHQAEGADPSPIFDGGPDLKRDYLTVAYNNYVYSRNDKRAVFCTNTGAEAKLYAASLDPGTREDLAAKRMLDEYVLKDSGGPLLNY